MLQNENKERIEDEKKELQKLLETTEHSKSIVFDAGAGSGKTYALVECLKYIVTKNYHTLFTHNQKVACITYTNVAANNIIKRIGNSEVVVVSTIHERIWEIIKDQQTTLLQFHLGKLEDEIQEIKKRLEAPDKYENYFKLSSEKKQDFKCLMLKNKETFYNAYYLGADAFREELNKMENFSLFFPTVRNIKTFKELVRDLYKLEDYKTCIENIKNKTYKQVLYDYRFNTDRLAKMQISHDTVLEYGKKAIENNNLLKQMIIDKYPYILIDEYQDTNKNVVEIMGILDSYSKKIKHNLYIAYFGDSAQNIYKTGVGNRLSMLHPNIIPLRKKYNRRSCEEIIDVGNRIRNEKDMHQISIYDNANQGMVKVFHGLEIEQFITGCCEELSITVDNKLHCLIPKNSDIARLCQFENYYNAFKTSDYYSGSNYILLNDELLSNDIKKLGEIQLVIYKILRLIKVVNDDHELVHNIENISNCVKSISLKELKTIIDSLKTIKGGNLRELMESIFSVYYSGDKSLKTIIEGVFGKETGISLQQIQTYISDCLYKFNNKKIDSLLDVEYQELSRWYKYITKEETNRIVYHTIHGSKGEEYDNVALIIGDNFQSKDKFFKNFFLDYDKKAKEDKYYDSRNLLYVACTRTKYNLYVLYTDDISNIQENIKRIFGVEINDGG